MRGAPPPLRFLGLALFAWVSARALVLMPLWQSGPVQAAPAAVAAQAEARAPEAAAPPLPEPAPAAVPTAVRPAPSRTAAPAAVAALPAEVRIAHFGPPPGTPLMVLPQPPQPVARPSPPGIEPRRGAARWSADGWLLARGGGGGGGAALAPGGTLSGSQAGLRLRYRLNGDAARPVSLSARLSGPLGRGPDEAALGLEWQPRADLPLRLLGERRQALGRDGRSAFALALHGGGEARLAGGDLRLQAWGQAGLVGAPRRDAFVDGAVDLALPVGPVELGGGAWGAAQPGAARIDVGPQLALPLRAGDAQLRLSAGWRFRVAGEAAPGSGPALTLGAGF